MPDTLTVTDSIITAVRPILTGAQITDVLVDVALRYIGPDGLPVGRSVTVSIWGVMNATQKNAFENFYQIIINRINALYFA